MIGQEEAAATREPPLSVYEGVFSSLHGDGISHHTFADIGKYTVFPEAHYKRMFPSKVFGRIEETETKEVGALAIMTREEGLRLTNELSRLTLPKDRHINYTEIATTLTNVQAKQEIV